MEGGKKRIQRTYTAEYRVEALKLIREIGRKQSAIELGVPQRTLVNWEERAAKGDIDTGAGSQTPAGAMTQAQEIQTLKAEMKALRKENARLTKENDFLEEAARFFAVGRQKSEKKNDSAL